MTSLSQSIHNVTKIELITRMVSNSGCRTLRVSFDEGSRFEMSLFGETNNLESLPKSSDFTDHDCPTEEANQNKFTPGHWFVRLSDNATPHIMHSHGYDFTDIDDKTSLVCVMPVEILTSYNSLANATLIASAPDLIKALRGLAMYCNGRLPISDLDCHAMQEAARVIAKAEGRAIAAQNPTNEVEA